VQTGNGAAIASEILAALNRHGVGLELRLEIDIGPLVETKRGREIGRVAHSLVKELLEQCIELRIAASGLRGECEYGSFGKRQQRDRGAGGGEVAAIHRFRSDW